MLPFTNLPILQALSSSSSSSSSSSWFCFVETEGQQANVKAHDAVDHLANFRQVERRFHNRDLNHQPLP
jgi:hypothetical protein